MKSILIVNPKGGCGKTTLATNLASFYAVWDVPVAIVDLDPQKSSLDWLRARPARASKIHGVSGLIRRPEIPRNTRRVIYDAPARSQLATVSRLIDLVDVVLIPVLPSAMDMRVTAKFIADLLIKVKVRHRSVKVAIVGNRMHTNFKSSKELDSFLMNADIPFLAKLRASQKYVHAASNGLGIFDMLPSAVKKDVETWKPLVKWVEETLIT